MSLDLYVKKEVMIECPHCKETIPSWEYRYVWDFTITHNLATMANAAGIYGPLRSPKDIAKDNIDELEKGIKKLIDNPDVYKKYNPDNGRWDYEGLVKFAIKVLKCYEENPEGIVSVSV